MDLLPHFEILISFGSLCRSAIDHHRHSTNTGPCAAGTGNQLAGKREQYTCMTWQCHSRIIRYIVYGYSITYSHESISPLDRTPRCTVKSQHAGVLREFQAQAPLENAVFIEAHGTAGHPPTTHDQSSFT